VATGTTVVRVSLEVRSYRVAVAPVLPHRFLADLEVRIRIGGVVGAVADADLAGLGPGARGSSERGQQTAREGTKQAASVRAGGQGSREFVKLLSVHGVSRCS
jgi:hypothetical protein